MKNVFYFYYINSIGGVETFFYELAKKYCKYDITILYSKGNQDQINRLKKYARVIKYNNEKIVCDKIFFNYNADIISNVQAKEYYMIIHADYEKLKIPPPRVPNCVKFIGVSKAICDSFMKYTGKPCVLCYNPITIESDNIKRPLQLISATRLTSEKGWDRMQKLAQILNKNNINFEWRVYTNTNIKNKNFIFKSPTLDIKNDMMTADYIVQLSDTESYCYTIIEALCLGKPIIVTDFPCLKELNITNENGFILPFDFTEKDIDFKKLCKNNFNFKYQPPQDIWNELLAPGESEYYKNMHTFVTVEATDKYQKNKILDIELGRIPEPGERWEVNLERLKTLQKYKEKIINIVTTNS